MKLYSLCKVQLHYRISHCWKCYLKMPSVANIHCEWQLNEWMNDYGISMKWYWQEKTEVLGENPVSVSFVHHKTNMDWSGFEPRPVQWETGGQQLELHHGWASVIFVITACFVVFTLLVSAHLQACGRDGLTFHTLVNSRPKTFDMIV